MATTSISSTSIVNNISSSNSNNNHNRFDNLINKYRTRGLDAVADFLTTKARKSKRTVLTFSFVIDYLNKFIIQNYSSGSNNNSNNYDIQTILAPNDTSFFFELRRIYKEDCMKYLTFLDYPTLEATGRSFEAKLNAVVDQKDKQIAELKNKIRVN